MINISIIGRNSRLYNELRLSKNCFDLNIREYGYRDVEEVEIIENPIVFAYSRNLKENLLFLNKIAMKCRGKFIYISSTAVTAHKYISFYHYPKLKYEGEQYVATLSNSCIIRVGVTVKSVDMLKGYCGRTKATTYERLSNAIRLVSMHSTDTGIIDATEIIYVKGVCVYRAIHSAQIFVFKYSKITFWLLRPFLFFFRAIGYKNYGYTFISNQECPESNPKTRTS
jgi:hypothetical protein